MSDCSTQPVIRREETVQRPSAYSGGHFLEIHVGDVFEGHYVVVEKLGYGMQATIWLVHDCYKGRYFAMKVLSTECDCFFEVEVLEHLGLDGFQDPGHQYVSNLVDSFSKQSSIGKTVFLIFDVMAETLPQFMQKVGYISPEKIMKKFVKQLLLALDHAHKSGVVHTDIKPDNIMIQLPNEGIIKEAVTPWKTFKVEDKEPRFLYWPNDNAELMRRQHGIDYDMMLDVAPTQHTSSGMGDFYIDEDVTVGDVLSLKVSLCDWGLASWTDEHLYEEISNVTMRSPEVLLGAPWDTKTDIWSLGIVIYEVISGRDMFNCVNNEPQYRYLTEEERKEQEWERQQERERLWEEKQEVPQADDEKVEFRECENRYDLGVHLNEIATMLEPFPQSLLKNVGGGNEHSRHIKSLFSNDGTIWGYDEYNLPPLEHHFPHIPEGEDKENFLDLLYKMMRVDPKDRASAEELLKEPWLQDVVPGEEGFTPLSTPWFGDELKQPYCEPIYPGDKIVDPLESDKERITPPTPLPTPPPKHDHEGTYCDFTDTLHDLVDPLDCDSASDTSSDCSHSTHSDTSAHTNSTTLNLDYLIDLAASEDIGKTDSDDDTLADMEIEISTTCTNALTRVDSRISDPNDGFVVDMDVGTSDSCARTTTPILEPLDDIFADVNDFVADIGVETFITPTTLTPEPLYENAAQPDINIAPIIKKSAPVAKSTNTSSPSQKKAKSNAGKKKKNKNKNKKNKKGKRAAKR